MTVWMRQMLDFYTDVSYFNKELKVTGLFSYFNVTQHKNEVARFNLTQTLFPKKQKTDFSPSLCRGKRSDNLIITQKI